MRGVTRVLVSGAIMAGMGGALVSAQTASVSPIEGTTWSVKVVPDEMAAHKGERPTEDTLIFKDGKLTSTACVKYGFAASPYTITQLGALWSFKSVQQSKRQGMTVWSGEVNGEAIQGTMSWTKKSGAILNYTFSGAKAEEQKAQPKGQKSQKSSKRSH